MIITLTPEVDTSAYGSGDNIGGLITISSGVLAPSVPLALLKKILVTDAANQGANLTALFFDSEPTESTFNDNAAVSIHADDIAKLVASITLTTHVTFGSVKLSSSADLNLPIQGTPSGALYMALQSNGTPTYTASALTVRLAFDK